MKDRTYINSTAENLCQKLESLEVAKIPISPLKLLAVQVETLFVAWQNGALSQSYLQTSLDKLTSQMADIESHHLAPPGWRAVWDRYDPFALLFLLFLSYQHFCVKTKHYQIITWNNVRPKNVALCAQDQLWIWRFWTFLRCASKIKEQSRNSCQIMSLWIG